MNTPTHKQIEMYLKITIAIAAVILVVLCILLVREYRHLRRLDYVAAHRSLFSALRAHGPVGASDVSSVATRHPGPTIFLTRFVGTADPLANVLSGFVGISFGTFLLYDFLGNVVSIGGVLYAGYFLGIHWQDFSTFFSIARWILLGFIMIAALAVALWYRHKFESRH